MMLRNMASVYLMKNDNILLLFREGSRVANRLWVASAGGHFEEWELNNPKACALRELYEELSVSGDMICNLRLRYITLRKTQGEIRQNYYFFADLKSDSDSAIVSNEGVCRWFGLDEILDLEMPLSAKQMLTHFIKTGISNDKLYVGAAEKENAVFTELAE